MPTRLSNKVDGDPSIQPPATDTSTIDKRVGQVIGQCFTVEDLAELLQCSTRHVWRQLDAGKLLAAIRIGRLVRWPRKLIEDWIADGCPSVRRSSR
jgi:excisionase family DNA binding protein